MLFSKPLPNDLLRNPPWADTIATWPINDPLISSIDQFENKLDELGFYLKFGIEANLGILTLSEAEKLCRTRAGLSPIWLWRQSCREHFKHAISEQSARTQSQQPIQDVYAILEKIADKKKIESATASAHQNQGWLNNWEKVTVFYRRSLSERNTAKTDLARKNFMIAALHLLPQSLGGLEGMIEQRFASAHYGIGWWDGINTIELRTMPVIGHESAIAQYHQVLWRLKQAADYFGLVPDTRLATGQVHFSLWRKADDTNLFLAKDEASLNFQAKIAETIRDFLVLCPIRKPSVFFGLEDKAIASADAPFIGSSRASVIRICEGGHWELRLPEITGVTHLASNIYAIANAVSTALTPDESEDENLDNELREKFGPDSDIARYVSITDVYDPDFSNRKPVRHVKKMSVIANPARVACPFVSSFEASVIDDNGKIEVPLEVFAEYNGQLLLDKIGRNAADLYSVVDNGEIYNLEKPLAWQKLFKELKLLEDGSVDTSRLHPLLAHHFHCIKITGFHNDIHGGELTKKIVKTRPYANAVMASRLASGKDAGEDKKEIYGFISEAHRFSNSEEIALLLTTCYVAAKKGKRLERKMETTLQGIIFILLQETLGEALRRRRKEGTSIIGQMPSALKEPEILRMLILFRKNLLSALPTVSDYNSLQSSRYFDQMKVIFEDSAKLFSPENIGFILGEHSATSFSEKSFNSIAEDIREPIKNQLSELGQSMGRTTIRLVAGVEENDTKRHDLLMQYQAVADTFYQKYKLVNFSPEDGERFPMCSAMSDGVQEGLESEIDGLLSDMTPILQLRQAALG